MLTTFKTECTFLWRTITCMTMFGPFATFPKPFQQSILQGQRFSLCPVARQHFGTMEDIFPIRVTTLLFCRQHGSNVFISRLLLSENVCPPTVCQDIYSDGLNLFTPLPRRDVVDNNLSLPRRATSGSLRRNVIDRPLSLSVLLEETKHLTNA